MTDVTANESIDLKLDDKRTRVSDCGTSSLYAGVTRSIGVITFVAQNTSGGQQPPPRVGA